MGERLRRKGSDNSEAALGDLAIRPGATVIYFDDEGPAPSPWAPPGYVDKDPDAFWRRFAEHCASSDEAMEAVEPAYFKAMDEVIQAAGAAWQPTLYLERLPAF